MQCSHYATHGQRPFGRTGLTAVQGYHHQSDMVVCLQRVQVLLFVVVGFLTWWFFFPLAFFLFIPSAGPLLEPRGLR